MFRAVLVLKNGLVGTCIFEHISDAVEWISQYDDTEVLSVSINIASDL